MARGDTVAISRAETRDSLFSLGALENKGWALTHADFPADDFERQG